MYALLDTIRLIYLPMSQTNSSSSSLCTIFSIFLIHSLSFADCPVFSPQAEVWDLEILRSNNSTWPVDATDLKDGVITIKGHTDVGHLVITLSVSSMESTYLQTGF